MTKEILGNSVLLEGVVRNKMLSNLGTFNGRKPKACLYVEDASGSEIPVNMFNTNAKKCEKLLIGERIRMRGHLEVSPNKTFLEDGREVPQLQFVAEDAFIIRR